MGRASLILLATDAIVAEAMGGGRVDQSLEVMKFGSITGGEKDRWSVWLKKRRKFKKAVGESLLGTYDAQGWDCLSRGDLTSLNGDATVIDCVTTLARLEEEGDRDY